MEVQLYDVLFDFSEMIKYQVDFKMDFQITEKTKKIVLDGKPTFFKNFSSIKQKENEISFSYSHTTIRDRNKITIEFDEELEVGEYQMNLKYSSTPTASCQSIFLTEKDEILYTQMEPHLCSRVFPCLDDNWNKNFFKFSFIIPNEKDVISNMEIEKTSEFKKDKKLVQFKKTPKIPA